MTPLLPNYQGKQSHQGYLWCIHPSPTKNTVASNFSGGGDYEIEARFLGRLLPDTLDLMLLAGEKGAPWSLRTSPPLNRLCACLRGDLGPMPAFQNRTDVCNSLNASSAA
jgi:hypothetical protein